MFYPAAASNYFFVVDLDPVQLLIDVIVFYFEYYLYGSFRTIRLGQIEKTRTELGNKRMKLNILSITDLTLSSKNRGHVTQAIIVQTTVTIK